MNRIPNRKKGRAFYIPTKGIAGAAVVDSYGSVYSVDKNGAIRRRVAHKHCTANKV
jgi:hypothetical protein